MVKASDKEKAAQEPSSSKEGEEIDIPKDFEASKTILEHIKKYYRQYESMKAHQEEMKDIAELKLNLGYPTTQRKGKIEPKTKAREDKATSRARAE